MIANRFHDVAKRLPDAPAVVDGTERISYAELARRQTLFLGHLTDRLRLSRGELVAVSLPNCWQFIASFFAVAEAGGIFIPLNTEWRSEELRSVTERLPVSLLITNRKQLERWREFEDGVVPDRVFVVDDPELVEALPPDERPMRPEFREDSVVYFLTSGTTGRPRAAPRSHRNLIAGATNVGEALGIREGMRFLGVVPFYHANGFSNSMLLPILSGATVVVMRGFTPGKLAQAVRSEGIDTLIAPPFIYSMLVDHGAGRETFRTVELSLSSGAPMSRGLATECAERLGLNVRQLYGSSETGTISIETGEGDAEQGSVGVPVPFVEVRIAAEDGAALPVGERGEITVRSPAMMSGYVGEPECNQHAFRDGFFRMGDLGQIDARGSLILSGRTKQIINVAGIKVDPAEIERVLERMPGVRECRADGVSNERNSEAIRVRIVMRPGNMATRRDVILHCREHLAEYKIPRVVEFVSGIAVNAAGKQPRKEVLKADGVSRS